MECKHQYTQWKGQIKTCLFCNTIVNFQDMLQKVVLPNGKETINNARETNV